MATTKEKQDVKNEVKFSVPDYSPPDWTIGDLYSQAWHLVKNNKILWVFGIAVAAFGSGSSGNFNFPSGSGDTTSDLSPSPSPMPSSSFDPSNLPVDVLGDATSNVWSELFSLVPTYTYVLLGLEIFALIILGVIIALVGKAWANAALLHAIEIVSGGKQTTIKDSSEKAMSNIKAFMWLFFVPTFLFGLITLVALTPGILALVFGNTGLKILGGFLTFIIVLVWAYFMLRITMAISWAQRKVVQENQDAKSAFWDGYKIAGRKYWSGLLLGFVNNFVSGLIVGIPMIILIGIFFAGFLTFESNAILGGTFIAIAALILFIFFLALVVVNGIISAFKATVWSLAYKKIRGKYDGTKN